MSAREFVANLAIVSAIMAVAALIEMAIPFVQSRGGRTGRERANLALTTVVFLLNWALSTTPAVLALLLSWRSPGLASRLNLPAWIQIAAGFVLLDFSVGYLSHRTLHMIPALWRFHRVHHSDDFIDVTTTYRTHPVETVWRFVFAFVPVWTLGIPATAVVLQRLVSAANGILEHGNIRLWAPLDRVLSLVWVTPNVPKIHHSRLSAETNSNYGNVLTLYDRLLGTFTPSERAPAVVYGLEDVISPRDTFAGLLAMPFDGTADAVVTGTNVRKAPAPAR